MKARERAVPAARTEGLLIQELVDEVLVYDLVRHKAHCLNQTAALVWRHCDGNTTVNQIATLLEDHTKAPVDAAVVLMACEQLSKSHLMQGQVRTGASAGMSRREVMRRLGTAAAIAIPVVTSIAAPGAIQAATCRASGQACTTSAQCCTLSCNAGVCA